MYRYSVYHIYIIKRLLFPVVLAAAVASSGVAYTPDRPTPGVDASFHPLGTPQASPGASTSYAFLDHNDDGSPVSYDPCRPIHYVIRTANQPATGPEMVNEAIDAVSQATGLVFINDGTTNEVASPKRPLYQPDRHGDRWAPVLIDWQIADENPVMTDRPTEPPSWA